MIQINTRQVELNMFGAPLSIDTSSSPYSIAVGATPSGAGSNLSVRTDGSYTSN